MAEITLEKVLSIAEGKCTALRDGTRFAQIARRDGKLVVECGWEVPEADEDDYLSSTYHPFKNGRACPWVGRRTTTTDASEARRVYLGYADALWGSGNPATGEVIGSVFRGEG